MKNVAVVCFDGGVRAHQEGLLFLQRSLEGRERAFYLLGCDGALSRCTTLNSYGQVLDDAQAAALKRRACAGCIQAQKRFNGGQAGDRLAVSPESDALRPDQQAVLSWIAEEVKIPDQLVRLEYGGLPLGRILLFDFLIVNKIGLNDQISKPMLENLVSHARDSFFLVNFMRRVLAGTKFDLSFYVNGNTSLNALCSLLLRQSGARTWSIEYSMGLSEAFCRVFTEENRLPVVHDWAAVQPYYSGTYNPSPKSLQVALAAMRDRVYGRDYNSYTSPARTSLWDKFDQFRSAYPELVSVFLSSGDELNSHTAGFEFQPDTRFFANQLDWLDYIVENAAPGVGYVVRVHPRMSPNKRDKVKAPELDRLRPLLERARAKSNFLVIEPQESISSYYIMLNSTATLNAWSTVGLESAVLGIPSVVSFPLNTMYPAADFSRQPQSLEELRAIITSPHLHKIEPVHDENIVRWLSIFYADSHLLLPVVRCADRKWRKLAQKVVSLFLASRLFSRLLAAPFRKRVSITSENKLEFRKREIVVSSIGVAECIKLLKVFREESRRYFGMNS